MSHRRQDGSLGELALAFLLAGWIIPACGQSDAGPRASSNSNWYVTCEPSGECGEESVCLCGACSAECGDDSDCAQLEGAVCRTRGQLAISTQCGASPPLGMCLPPCSPGSCDAGQSCVDGACVLVTLPPNDLCAPVAAPSDEDRRAEEELFALFQKARVDGSLPCTEGVAPAPPFRLVGELVCAARIKARDQEDSGVNSSEDSLGRTAADRIELAGHTGTGWQEDNLSGVENPREAFDRIVSDPDDCPDYGDSARTSLGIGVVGGNYVVTMSGD